MYLPFRPIKGQAFRLYFNTAGTYNIRSDQYSDAAQYAQISFVNFSSIGVVNFKISKDGASESQTVNAPVQISTGVGYIDFTAEEMNCDCAIFVINYNRNTLTYGGYSVQKSINIYTQPEELTSAPTKLSSLEDKITALFQYFFGKRTVTANKETLYQDDGATVLGEGNISDDGTTVTKGKVS